MIVRELKNFVAGEFVPAASQKCLDNLNPATAQVISTVPDSDVIDVVRAVQAANKASAAWAKTTSAERARWLEKIATSLEAKAEELAALISRDQGMPVTQARTRELPQAIAAWRSQARLLQEPSGPSFVDAQVVHFTCSQPLGVVAILAPWAQPLVSLSRKLAPALAAGNVVIVKPSSSAPEAAFALAEILQEAGLPPGVCNVIFGRGEVVGETLSQHPGIDGVSFTGQVENGRKIWAAAGEQLKKVHLAHGGRNPVLVFADADLDRIMPQLTAACFDIHGPVHLRGSRIFVQETILDRFLERFQTEIQALTVGNPLDPDTRLGPLVSAGLRERLQGVVETALKERAKQRGEVKNPDLPAPFAGGFFVPPSVLVDLTYCSTLQQEELLGPVVTVASFKYQHEALKHANTSPFGQAAYVWTGDGNKALKVAPKIEASRIFVNSGPLPEERLPYAGMKLSGSGLEGERELSRFFSRSSLVSLSLPSSS